MRKKTLFFLLTGLVLVIFGLYLFYTFLPVFYIPQRHSVKFENDKFTSLTNSILNQDQIFKLSDSVSHNLIINDTSIKMPLRLNEIDSLHINKYVLDDLKTKLLNLRFKTFYKSHDSILLIEDIYEDRGYLFNPEGLKNYDSSFNFGSYQLEFMDRLSKNWRRVSIHQ